MRQRIRNWLINTFVIVQITLVGLIALNNALFIHRHILPNGDVVTHAHPYKKSGDTAPFKTHTHTTSELFLLAGLSKLLVVISIAVAIVLSAWFYKQKPGGSESFYTFFLTTLRGRAPPVSI
jgi:hypothetical protein